MRTPIPYYGAKVQMSKRIASLIPPRSEYVEPFCGSGAVFFALDPEKYDAATLSDHNRWIINSLQMVRDHPKQLALRLPSRVTKDDWRRMVDQIKEDRFGPDLIQNAVVQIAGWWTSFNTSPWSGSQSQRMTQQYYRALHGGELARRFQEASSRMHSCDIAVADALNTIRMCHQEHAIFCDPPYMFRKAGGGSRGAAYAGYGPWDQPDPKWHAEFIGEIISAHDRGASITLTLGNDPEYNHRLSEIGFRMVNVSGIKGSGRGKGGTATDKHLIWVNNLPEARLL